MLLGPQECAARALPADLTGLQVLLNEDYEGQGVDEKDIETLRRIMGPLSKSGAFTSSTKPAIPSTTPATTITAQPTTAIALDTPSPTTGIVQNDNAGITQPVIGAPGASVSMSRETSVPRTPPRDALASLPPTPIGRRTPPTSPTRSVHSTPTIRAPSPALPKPKAKAKAKPKAKGKRAAETSEGTDKTATQGAPKRRKKARSNGEALDPPEKETEKEKEKTPGTLLEGTAGPGDAMEVDNGPRVAPLVPPSNLNTKALILPAFVLQEPTKKYIWAKNGLASLLNIAGGEKWNTCIWYWLELEIDNEFKDGRRLEGKNRHKSVSDWIARARASNWMGLKEAPTVYEEKFWSWWRSAQPEWRGGDDISSEGAHVAMKVLPPDGDDWEDIRCMGSNGLLSALGALLFWGSAVFTMPMAGYRANERFDAAEAAWLVAVTDVNVVLSGLLSTRSTTYVDISLPYT